MNLEDILPSEIRQSQQDKLCTYQIHRDSVTCNGVCQGPGELAPHVEQSFSVTGCKAFCG